MKLNYTILILTMLLSASGIKAQNTWYTLASGDWDNAAIWTLDPAGAVPVGSAVPAASDNVVILTGKTVTVPDGLAPYDAPAVRNMTLVCGKVTLIGQLDLRKSTGHVFTSLSGSGRILMAADNYPMISDDSKFISQDGNEGTCVYYGDNLTVSSPHTFYNLEVNMNAGQTLTLDVDYVLNGNLLIKKGALQLGNSNGKRVLSVHGDILVNASSSLGVGGGASGANALDFHRIICSGNIINNGTIKLTNQNAPVYDDYPKTGAAILTLQGASNTTFTCNGTTDLNRLILDKDNAVSTVALSASAESHFRLYGCNNVVTTDKALYLKKGTLQLSGAVFIPSLTEGGADFCIGTDAELHLNGGNVKVFSTARSDAETNVGGIEGTGVSSGTLNTKEAFSILGTFKISDGLIDTKTHGFVASDAGNAIVKIEGGTVITPGFRSEGTQTGRWSYNQSGGLVKMLGDKNAYYSNSATFCIKGTNNVFIMSGGEMEIYDTGIGSDYEAIRIESGDGNHSVTGGTVRINRLNTEGGDYIYFEIWSTAPLYNLELDGTNSQEIWLYEPLTVLNNLTVNNPESRFHTQDRTLEIGGNFTNYGNFTYSGNHTTRFIGSKPSIVSGGTVKFDNLELAKDNLTDVLTFGAGELSIADDLTISKGTFDVGQADIGVAGNIDISYGNITGEKALILNGGGIQTLKGKDRQNPSFGNLKLKGYQVKLLSDVDATLVEFQKDQLFDLDVYNLDTDSVSTVSGKWSGIRLFKVSSAIKGVNGSLTLPVILDASKDSYNDSIQFFPIEIDGWYNPVHVYTTGTKTDKGKMTVTPVYDSHPTISNDGWALPCYWSIDYTGLTSVTSADMRYKIAYGVDLPDLVGVEGGAVFHDNEWSTYDDVGSIIETGQTIIWSKLLDFDFNTPIKGDYTYLSFDAVDNPRTLYSRAAAQAGGSAPFDNADSWTLDPDHDGPAVTLAPELYDNCVIGGANGQNHTIVVDNDDRASQVYIKGKSETGITAAYPPTLQMTNVSGSTNLGFIKGHGRIYYTDGTIPPINFTHFCSSQEAIFEYAGKGAGTDYEISSYIPYYPNLHFSGAGKIKGNNSDMVVHGNLFVDDATFEFSRHGSGDAVILGNVIINTGTLSLPNYFVRTVDIDGDIIFNGNGELNITPGAYSFIHQINLDGNIVQGTGSVKLNTITGPTVVKCSAVIHFNGLETTSVSKTSGTTDFYRMEINKPMGKKVEFTADFTLPENAGGSVKNLILTSGECLINNPAININLSTGGNDFIIPSGTRLNVDKGTVNVGGNTSDTGIRLDGSLTVGSAGVVNCDRGSAEYPDNYIEYTASGDAAISLGDGAQLYVGSQIRRSTVTDEGVLNFTQSSANTTVVVGSKSAGNSSRGVFEIWGENSSFTQVAGANITLLRGHGNLNPALYFDPGTVSIGDGAGFTFDSVIQPSKTIAVYAGKALGDITLSGYGASVIINSLPLTLNGNLTIDKGVFNANGLDLILKGNITKSSNGHFVANENTTYFESDADRRIEGNLNFAAVVKQGGNGALTLAPSSPVTVGNNLTLSSGTLNTGANDLTVQGNLINNINTFGSGATQGIVMAGNDVQELSGSGTFYRLTIDNANNVVLPLQSGSVSISNRLKLLKGVFDIGRNLLVIQENASITGNATATPFSEFNMIQTNLSFVDNGIQKYFPEVSGATTTFTYPIGSIGKYTPVVFDITEKSAGKGSIRVKAAGEPHVSIPAADKDEVLQCYWTMDAEGIDGLVANAYMHFYEDAAVNYGDTAAYQTARILLSGIDWYKLGDVDFHGGSSNNYLHFRLGSTGAGTDDAGIDGDYTAGAKIPDQVPAFISVADGNWNSQNTWAEYNPATGVTGATGAGVPADGPRGAVVYVNNTVSMPNNFMAAYRTKINASGTIDVGTSLGHRLGDVFGTGRLKVMSGDLPAGEYNDFFSATGGTLEYAGSNNYDILSEVTSLNNLVLSGTGERRLPNIDFQLWGNLTMSGVDVINSHHRSMALKGDITFTSGSFDAGTAFGSRIPTITMNGDQLQRITGPQHFTASNTLYNFEVNSAVGVRIENDIDVDNVLKLSQGIIYTDEGGNLTIMKSTADAFLGGSNTSYVQGPLRKNIIGGDSFTFPMGDATRYGEIKVMPENASSGIWSVRYYNSSPENGGMSPNALDPEVHYVSHNEYWDVQAPSIGLKANMLLRWDANSGVNPNDDFRVVKWTAGSPPLWGKLDIANKLGDASGGTVNLSTALTFGFNGTPNHYISFGSIHIAVYQWKGSVSGDWFDPNNWDNTVVPDAGTDITIDNKGTAPYVDEGSVAQVNNLTINHSGGLTLRPGGQMTVNGNLSTNGNLVIKNTNAKPASLITYGTVSGNVSVQWVYDEMRWWFIGHETANPQMDAYRSIPITDPTNKFVMYDYDNSERLVKISGNSSYNFAADDELRGYQLKVLKPATLVKHAGILNNAVSYEKAVQPGWQIIANPYASYYQLPSNASGTGDFSATTGSVYVTVSTSNQDKVFETFNTNSGIHSPSTFSGVIAPSQAFYVKTVDSPAAGAEITMRAANRVHDTNKASLKSMQTTHDNILRVKLSNEHNVTDEAVIALRPGGDKAMTQMDSEQRYYTDTKLSYIYSVVDGLKAVINVLPEKPDHHGQALGMLLKAGKQVIRIEGIDQLKGAYDVVLEDKENNVFTTMDSRTSYEFTSEAGIFDNRFVLHFNEVEVPTEIDEPNASDSQVDIYIQNKSTLQVTCNWNEKKKTVSLFTVSGQQVVSETFNGSIFSKELSLKTGIYIVKLGATGKSYEQKVLVK